MFRKEQCVPFIVAFPLLFCLSSSLIQQTTDLSTCTRKHHYQVHRKLRTRHYQAHGLNPKQALSNIFICLEWAKTSILQEKRTLPRRSIIYLHSLQSIDNLSLSLQPWLKICHQSQVPPHNALYLTSLQGTN